jgi:uncharacterized protein
MSQRSVVVRSFDVCSFCGMCCDGTLFDWGKLRSDEVAHAEAIGLVVRRQRDGAPGFDQPCAQFQNGCCAVYEQAPSVCRSYECRLLPEAAAGRMSMDDCLDVIQMMRSVTQRIEESIGVPPGWFNASALHRFLDETRPQDRAAEYQPLLSALARFNELAAEYFGKPRSGGSLVSDAAARVT